MQTYIFYYNEAYEYLHMIDTIKDRFKYKQFHYEQKQIVHLTKHKFQYAIEFCIPVSIYNNLLEYYKCNKNVKFEIQECSQSRVKTGSILKHHKHIHTDICKYDDAKSYEILHKPNSKKLKKMMICDKHPIKNRHISKQTYDELYNVLNYK